MPLSEPRADTPSESLELDSLSSMSALTPSSSPTRLLLRSQGHLGRGHWRRPLPSALLVASGIRPCATIGITAFLKGWEGLAASTGVELGPEWVRSMCLHEMSVVSNCRCRGESVDFSKYDRSKNISTEQTS